jgi:hypothetical protein
MKPPLHLPGEQAPRGSLSPGIRGFPSPGRPFFPRVSPTRAQSPGVAHGTPRLRAGVRKGVQPPSPRGLQEEAR